jgi:hypothetical protein
MLQKLIGILEIGLDPKVFSRKKAGGKKKTSATQGKDHANSRH